MEEQSNNELSELKAKLLKCKQTSDSHRKARDYHKELNAQYRQELSDTRKMAASGSSEAAMLHAELEEAEHKHEFWKTLAVFFAFLAFCLAALFVYEVRQ